MEPEEVQRAAVIGAGTMGRGIAQVMAQVGINVVLIDSSPEIAAAALETLHRDLNRLVTKGKMNEADIRDIVGRIHVADGYEECGDVQVAIEAVIEDREVKREVFRRLDVTCPRDAILLTNTSTLSPTDMASATSRPGAVAGFHFMNPVPVMKLVEIVTGLETTPQTVMFARGFAERLNKTPVVAREHPGGIISRIMLTMRNEAIRIYAEGIASAEDIDTAMKLGGNFPIGPLALTDLVGIDAHLRNSESLSRDLGPCYLPHPIVKTMVRAGKLGRKVGEGFFRYAPSNGKGGNDG